MRSALAAFGLTGCTPLTATSCSTQQTVFINDYCSSSVRTARWPRRSST